MRKLLNTLYITSEGIYLSLDGECIVANYPDKTKKLIPLHTLEGVVSFSYKGASPSLVGKCVQSGVFMSFYSPQGKFYYHVGNEVNGNVFLRREQYRIADDENKALAFAKSFIVGKLYNSKYVLHRGLRDHSIQVDVESLKDTISCLNDNMQAVEATSDIDSLRGIEGKAAVSYFSAFPNLILQNKEFFKFQGRVRRPATDPVNALLSFTYTLLSNDCASALRGVGLDPYVGFMHTDRPGRKSLGLDLVEELRSVYADRFVLTLINNRIVCSADFEKRENGEVLLSESGRNRFLTEWQGKKRDEIVHPFLKEKIKWGLVPYVQALLLARAIRGDLDCYPPFFWK
jgi:CRISP-associated protein Cas1